jgi:hypothetical protein
VQEGDSSLSLFFLSFLFASFSSARGWWRGVLTFFYHRLFEEGGGKRGGENKLWVRAEGGSRGRRKKQTKKGRMGGWARSLAFVLFVACDVLIDALVYSLFKVNMATSNWIAVIILFVKAWLAFFLFMDKHTTVKPLRGLIGAPIIIFASLSARVRVILIIAITDITLLQLALIYRHNQVAFRMFMSLTNITTVALIGSLVKLSSATLAFEKDLENHPTTHPTFFILQPFLDLIENLFSLREWAHKRDTKFIRSKLDD